MNIKGLEYNTQREVLPLPEYGREIYLMVQHAIGLPTRSLRLQCAKTIVRTMEIKVPQVHGSGNYKQTLWDHLYLLSGGRLDIDWPYDVSNASSIQARPKPMPLPQRHIVKRHYGYLVAELTDKLRVMPDGPERDKLARLTACQMKRDLLVWGHGTTDDKRVAADLAEFTGGRVQCDFTRHKLPTTAAIGEAAPVRRKRKR